MIKRLVFLLIGCFHFLTGSAQLHLGTVEDLTFYSHSLEKETTVRIYLPPGYQADNPVKKYPVIVSLHGASVGYELYSYMYPIIDALWLNNTIDPFILVMPDGLTPPFNGSFWSNSSLYGNYEDLLSQELIPLIDSTYHTFETANFRAIMGHSMGAYGAFKQIFKHPGLYCAVAGHSGPLHIEKLDMLIPDIKHENGSPPYTWQYQPGKGLTNLIFTMAGAFSPNPESDNLVNFPLNEQAEIIDSVMNQWRSHNIVELARWHMPATGLAIYFDCGNRDEYQLFLHNRALSDTLNKNGIRHQYVEYFGDHTSGLAFRIPVALRFIDAVFKGNQTAAHQLAKPPTRVVRVFPNPSSGQVWFEPDDLDDLLSVWLMTADGKVLNQYPPHTNPINLSIYPKGTYYLLFQYRRSTSSMTISLQE